MDKKKSSQDAVRKSREKKKKMIEEKQMEKDNMEQEVQTLENELSYEKEKQLFVCLIYYTYGIMMEFIIWTIVINRKAVINYEATV